MYSFSDVLRRFPPSKFSPPVVDKNRCLGRPRLLDTLLQQGRAARLLSIQAGPGHGKSILAAQALAALGGHRLWYQVGRDDHDPVLFLAGLNCCCRQSISDYRGDPLQDLLEKGEVSAGDLATPVNLFLNALREASDGDVHLVLDDVHELKGQGPACDLLRLLIESAPKNLHIIITTRRPIRELMAMDIKPLDQLNIAGDQLNFSIDEIIDLHQQVHGRCLTTVQAETIYRSTAGWAMAVSMPEPVAGVTDNLSDYLQRAILGPLAEEERQLLSELSLLPEISEGTTSSVATTRDAWASFQKLAGESAFLRSHGTMNAVYSMHPLIREYLQKGARQWLGENRWRDFNRRAADYYLENGNPVLALRFSLALGDYEQAARLLIKQGLGLYSRSQYVTLQGLLDEFPESFIEESGWLCLLQGAVHLELKPEKARFHLQRARALLSEANEPVGELLALSLIIFYLGSISAAYEEAREVVDQAQALYTKIGEQLPDLLQMNVCTSLAAAYQFLDANFELARKYTDIALGITRQHRLVNRSARLHYFRFHAFLASGDVSQARHEVETLHRFEQDPAIDRINRGLILCAKLNMLYALGMRREYRHELQHTPLNRRGDILNNSIIGAYLRRWNCDLFLEEGNYSAAYSAASAGMHSSDTGSSKHMRSQFLQVQAASLALTGDRDEASRLAEESYELRRLAGEENQSVYNHLSLGVAYLVLEAWESADFHLRQSLQKAERLHKTYSVSSSYFYLSLLCLRQANEPASLRHLDAFGEFMKANDLDHFYFWIPDLAEDVLAHAVAHDHHPDLMRRLAARHLDKGISDKGGLFPLLHVDIQGGLSLRLQGETVIKGEELTRAQRDFLALLACQDDQQMSQNELQSALWPDVPADKARPRLDTLLRRLRSTLKKALAPWDVGNYLMLRKGVISLVNCQVDASTFREHALRGRCLFREGMHWMASIQLETACGVYRGRLLPGVTGFYSVTDLRRELQDLYLSACLDLCGLRKCEGDNERATELMVDALRKLPWDERLTRELFHLYIAQGEHRKAAELLQNYRRCMEDEGFGEQEVEDCLWAIRTEPELERGALR